MKKMTDESQIIIAITTNQLPLHCPLPDMSLWNQHPKVYLSIDASKKVKCPYCGTEYVLEEQ